MMSQLTDALIKQIVEIYNYYGYQTEVLAASIRHTMHIIQCLEAGADVATCPLEAILASEASAY
ncbi:hypothetical protein MASR1M46_04450 [Bacteroidales bacterium]